MPGGNRVSQGLHRRPATESPSRNNAEQRLWTISASRSGRRTALVNVIKTPLPGVLILQPQVFSDKRGSFMEIFHARRYAEAGIAQPFAQDNYSTSIRDTLRGLHFQE